MKKLITIIGVIVIALTVVNFQCNDNIVEPPPGNPPGYQQDIPWPSLANSPWPLYRADPQGTGRSKSDGFISGNLDWSIDTLRTLTTFSMGADSVLYVGVESINNLDFAGLIAFKPDGKMKWLFKFPTLGIETISSPIISSENVIYISSPVENKFYAINRDGTKNWELQLDGMVGIKSNLVEIRDSIFT